jgi:hypothetical protein
MKGVEMDLKRNALLVATVVLVVVAFAGGLQAERGAASLEKYKSALQFGIQSDLVLGSFKGGDISFKRRLSPKSALRYGVSLYYTGEDVSPKQGDRHYFSSGISVLYQRYVNPSSPAKFYWTMGPYANLRYSYDLISSDIAYTERTSKTISGGILGSIGVEWFATDVISLHAEYRMKAAYEWYRSEIEDKNVGKEPLQIAWERRYFTLSSREEVLFGISVYF